MHLPAITSRSGAILLLNVFEVSELADALGISLDAPFARQALQEVVALITKELSVDCSGLILGPEIGFSALDQKHDHCGLLLSLFGQVEEVAVDALPEVFPGWSVQHIRNNYGVVYLKLFYHPQSETALSKWQLLREVYDAASYEGVSVVLELALYPREGQDTSKTAFSELQLQVAQQLQSSCDALILEYPHSALAAATLTAQLDIPWILADRTQDYGYFKEMARTCIESGASGISMGSALWGNMPAVSFDHGQPKPNEWQAVTHYIHTELRDRVLELQRIVSELVVQQQALLNTTAAKK